MCRVAEQNYSVSSFNISRYAEYSKTLLRRLPVFSVRIPFSVSRAIAWAAVLKATPNPSFKPFIDRMGCDFKYAKAFFKRVLVQIFSSLSVRLFIFSIELIVF